jgi:hypothetical protein
MAAISVPGRLPNPPSTQIAKTRPIYSRPVDGSTGWILIRNARPPWQRCDRDAEGDPFDASIGGHRFSAQLVLRHRHDGAAHEARNICRSASTRAAKRAGSTYASDIDDAVVEGAID